MSLIPILLMITAWLTTPPDRAFMWELQMDQFYYAANARDMIRDGFHLSHANPYDPRPNAPRIYSHLFTLVVAVTARLTGIEPLYTYFILRPVLGILLAISVWYFLGPVFSEPALRRAAFLFLMLSGGISIYVSAARALYAVVALPGSDFIDILGALYVRVEELYGDWLCNIARNYFYMPELLYHAIWFLTLGCYLRGRHGLAVVGVAVEIYAHPFTGPALAALMLALSLCDAVLGPRRLRAVSVMAGLLCLLGLFGTYILWLNRDPGHRILQETWEHFIAVIPLGQYPSLYGLWLPAGVLSAILFFPLFKTSPPFRCAFLQAAVVFALMNHHLVFSRMIQPAHFSRGHFFTALVILTFFLWDRIRERIPAAVRNSRKALVAGLIVLSMDNMSFLLYVRVRSLDPPMTLRRDQAVMVHRLADIQPPQFVVSDGNMGQMIPVLTPHRALLGHGPNTPGYIRAEHLLTAWVQTGRTDLFDAYPDLSLAVLPRRSLGVLWEDARFRREWTPIHETPEYVMFQKSDSEP